MILNASLCGETFRFFLGHLKRARVAPNVGPVTYPQTCVETEQTPR